MFTLLTGLPGSSKSANCLELVEKERVREDGSKREVYYWGIPALKLDWKPLHRADSTPEEARAQFDLGVQKLVAAGGESHAFGWHEVPADSIVVIDECQFVFPLLTQKQRTNPPPHYGPLAVHRHSGFDLYCMTQHPQLIATEARRQVQRHWHLERPFGLDYANRFAWEKCQSPDDRTSRAQANVERIGLGKSMWGMYRSAEVHTVKKRLPWKKLAVVVGSLLAVVLLFVFAFWKLTASRRAVALSEEIQHQTTQADRVAVHQWTAESLTPRIPTWPWSAPFYDAAVKIVSAPRIIGCMSMKIDNRVTCTCSTGQGRANVPVAVCKDYMAGDYFDPTRPVEDIKAENIKRLDEASKASSGADRDGSGSGAYVVQPRQSESDGRS